MQEKIQNYISSIKSENSTTPAIVDYDTLIKILNEIFDKNLDNLEDFANSEIQNIFIYDIPEWKKEFNMETTKKFIENIALKPYFWKNFYILNNFDTAGISAQNSVLKTLEDSPNYAVIFLIVKNDKSLLNTVLSRVANLVKNDANSEILDQEIIKKIENFINWNQEEFLKFLYENEPTTENSINILKAVFPLLKNEILQKKCIEYIKNLYETNEKPRNILEAFFLWENFYN